MKKSILIRIALAALVAVGAPSAKAQGTIQFLNSTLSKIRAADWDGTIMGDAPVGTVVGVFYGSSAESLALADATVRMKAPGLFNGGVVYALPNTSPGQTVFLKIAAWFNARGPTPDLARSGHQSPDITCYGESAVVATTALGPTAGPGTVVWQAASGTNPNRAKAFVMVGECPEPSVCALAGCGLGALLLLGRRRPIVIQTGDGQIPGQNSVGEPNKL